MRKHTVLSGALAIAVAGFSIACGEVQPTKPSPPVQTTLESLQIVGPESLGAGRSAQFSVTITMSDGTKRSAMSMPNLKWISSNPAVMSVTDSGMVAANLSASGEATISAEIVSLGPALRDTRKVAIVHEADVTGELGVSLQNTGGQVAYAFNVRLVESAGGPATVTYVSIYFDNNWGVQCFFPTDKLRQTRIPANGNLDLETLTCGSPEQEPFNTEVVVELKDALGNQRWVSLRREPVLR